MAIILAWLLTMRNVSPLLSTRRRSFFARFLPLRVAKPATRSICTVGAASYVRRGCKRQTPANFPSVKPALGVIRGVSPLMSPYPCQRPVEASAQFPLDVTVLTDTKPFFRLVSSLQSLIVLLFDYYLFRRSLCPIVSPFRSTHPPALLNAPLVIPGASITWSSIAVAGVCDVLVCVLAAAG